MTTAKNATRKVREEKMWSLAFVGLLTIGLTTWLVVPSISASLQTGFSSYGKSVATYMFVYNTGSDNYQYRIPANVNDEISAISGVQEVYPIVANWTYTRLTRTLPNGTVE